MPYLIDTDVFIQAKNLHYGFDFCPAFWDWLIQQNKKEVVFSIEKVGNEIAAGTDELADWTALRGDTFFLAPDSTTIPALRTVSSWVTSQSYHPAAVNTFLQVADYYLVAQALAKGYTVVTHEKPDNSITRIKIPTVCIGLNVKCMTPFEMLRKEHARFILGS